MTLGSSKAKPMSKEVAQQRTNLSCSTSFGATSSVLNEDYDVRQPEFTANQGYRHAIVSLRLDQTTTSRG